MYLIASPIISALYNWAKALNLGKNLPFIPAEVEGESEPPLSSQTPVTVKEWFMDPMMIVSLLFYIGLIILFFYVYKKKKVLKGLPDVEKIEGFTVQTTNVTNRFPLLKFQRSTLPKNIIRKEMAEFERYACKLNLERKSSETIQDWFYRIGITEGDFINNLYEKVRYGEETESKREAEQFKENLIIKKKELKAIRSRLVESEEWQKGGKSSE